MGDCRSCQVFTQTANVIASEPQSSRSARFHAGTQAAALDFVAKAGILMARPYQSRISVSDEYLEAAGQALFNFAYAEGIVAYLVDSFVPGYINLTRGRTADEISGDLQLASLVKPDAEVSAVSSGFSDLSKRRDDLHLALPVTAANKDQILSTLHQTSESWDEETLWSFAKDAEDLAIKARELYQSRTGR